MIKKILFGLAVVAFAGVGVAIAQQTGIKRTPLQKLDFPAGYNTVTAIAEVRQRAGRPQRALDSCFDAFSNADKSTQSAQA